MPLLNLLLTSSSQQIELPSTIIAKHLHLKMVAVNLSAAAHADDVGMEIRLPFLHHGYNISSSYGRSNIVVPLSADVKSTVVYPNTVFMGSTMHKFKAELLNPLTGALWTSAGAGVIKSVVVMFEYSTI